MPGLFGDNTSNFNPVGGLLGGAGNFLQNMAASASPGLNQLQFQRQIMQQTYNALAQKYGPETGMILATHPGILDELAKPQVVAPGGQLSSALNIMGAGQQPQQSQQQPQISAQAIQSSPMPGMSPPQGAGITYSQNTTGMLNSPTLRNAAERYVLGDKDALTSAGMGALGNINKADIQNMITQIQKEQGISNEEMLQRQAKFPAYKKAVDKLEGQQATMGQAGLEFKALFPQFIADLQKYGVTGTNGISQFPKANEFFQWLDRNKGNPEVAPLQQRMTTLSNVYGRAVSSNPQSANTDYKHREFAEGLNQFWNAGQVGNIGDALMQEIQAAHDSVGRQMNVMAVQNGLGRHASADMMGEAKQKIAAGVPKNKITERMEEMGFSHDGL